MTPSGDCAPSRDRGRPGFRLAEVERYGANHPDVDELLTVSATARLLGMFPDAIRHLT